MRKLVTSLAAILAVACSNALAADLIYLSCDLNNEKGIGHFDFTLDESNSTVTFYVKEANATNTVQAVYGPETVTWSSNIGFSKLTRTISRVDLNFMQEFRPSRRWENKNKYRNMSDQKTTRKKILGCTRSRYVA